MTRRLPGTRSTTASTDAEVSIEWRCPRLREHMRGDYYDDELPKPCPDCYSVRITTERIPFDFAERTTPHPIRLLRDEDAA